MSTERHKRRPGNEKLILNRSTLRNDDFPEWFFFLSDNYF